MNVAAIASSESAQPLAGQELRKAKMARHASFSITPTSVAVQRQVSSAPSSPRREVTGKRFYFWGSCLFPIGWRETAKRPRAFFLNLQVVRFDSAEQHRAFSISCLFVVSMLQPCKTSLWIIPEGLQATVQRVSCSLEVMLSE